jgi:hypothetical protein
MNRVWQVLFLVVVLAGLLIAAWWRNSRASSGPSRPSASSAAISSNDSTGASTIIDSSRHVRPASSARTGSGSGVGPTVAADARCKENNGGATCTPTELLFMQKDTDLATGTAKNGKAFGCYDCLVTSGCLDDKKDPTDVHHECGDTGASGIREPTLTGGSAAEACLGVLSCILSSGCAGTGGAGACFCGTAVGEQCLTSPNGPCLAEVEDAVGTADPVLANKRFTNTAYGAGMANTILACAASNSCAGCYP